MKKLLSLALTSMLALPLAAFGQGTLKIGTINMDRAFKEYAKNWMMTGIAFNAKSGST